MEQKFAKTLQLKILHMKFRIAAAHKVGLASQPCRLNSFPYLFADSATAQAIALPPNNDAVMFQIPSPDNNRPEAYYLWTFQLIYSNSVLHAFP